MKTGALLFFGIVLGCFVYSANAVASDETAVLIVQVQTAGATTGSSGEEMVELYNQSSESVDMTGWCVRYASATNSGVGNAVACFTTSAAHERLILEPGGSVLLASSQFEETENLVADLQFNPGFSASGGHVALYDSGAVLQDKLGWGSAQYPEGQAATSSASGETMQRQIGGGLYVDTQNNRSDFLNGPLVEPATQGLYEAIDYCLNQELFPGQQLDIPDGYEVQAGGECVPVTPKPTCEGVQITEVVPNPSGVDNGIEYFELYNSHAKDADLSACVVLVDGKSVVLDAMLEAGGFYVVRGVALPNAAGGTIRLLSVDGSLLQEVTYPANLGDGQAYAYGDNEWEVTDEATPGQANVFVVIRSHEESGASSLSPCPTGKFRNPATNRCKMLAQSNGLRPCAADQVRNPETNRCRKITTLGASLKPCAPDQIRNPATNRCRKRDTVTALKPCDKDEERNPETNRCRKITGVAGTASAVNPAVTNGVAQNYKLIIMAFAAAVLYGLYEYRQDIMSAAGRLFGRSKQ